MLITNRNNKCLNIMRNIVSYALICALVLVLVLVIVSVFILISSAKEKYYDDAGPLFTANNGNLMKYYGRRLQTNSRTPTPSPSPSRNNCPS